MRAGGRGKENKGVAGRYDDRKRDETLEASALFLCLVRQRAEGERCLGEIRDECDGDITRRGDPWHLPGLPGTLRMDRLLRIRRLPRTERPGGTDLHDFEEYLAL